MKYLALAFIFLPVTLRADTCSELSGQLKKVEKEHLSLKLPICAGPNEMFCCQEDEPDSCLALKELNEKLESKLAQLTLFEGVIALAHALENKHTTLREITPSKLNEAKKNVDDFLSTLKKAKTLKTVLEMEGDSTFWEGYQGKDIDELSDFIYSRCEDSKDNKQSKFIKICSHFETLGLNNIEKKSSSSNVELLTMLHNFAHVDNSLLSNSKANDYESLKAALGVEIDGVKVSYDNIEQHPQIIKIKELKLTLEKSQKLKSKKEISEVQTELSKLLSQLSELKVNFQEGTNLKSKYAGHFDKNFKKELSKFDQSKHILLNTSQIKDNIAKMSALFKKQEKFKKEETQSSLEDFLESSNYSCENGETTKECFLRHCSPQSYNESCDTDNPLINTQYRKLLAYEKFAKLQESLSLGESCFKEQNIKEQHACLENVMKDFSSISDSSLKELKSEIKHLKKAKDIMYKNKDIIESLNKKRLIYNLLSESGCQMEKTSIKNMSSFCHSEELQTFEKELIELASATHNALVTLDDQTRSPASKEGQEASLSSQKTYRQNYLDNCSDTNDPACKKLRAMKAKKDQQKLKKRKYVQSIERQRGISKKDPDYYKQFDKQVDPSFLMGGIGQAIQAAFNLSHLNNQHQMELRGYNQNLGLLRAQSYASQLQQHQYNQWAKYQANFQKSYYEAQLHYNNRGTYTPGNYQAFVNYSSSLISPTQYIDPNSYFNNSNPNQTSNNLVSNNASESYYFNFDV